MNIDTSTIGVGDWQISERENQSRITINDKAGRAVASVPRRADDLDIARLIAAAPELREALHMVAKANDWHIEPPEDTYGKKAYAAYVAVFKKLAP